MSDNTPQRSSGPRMCPIAQSARPLLHEIVYSEDKEPQEIKANFVIEAVDMDRSNSEIHVTAYAYGMPLELKLDSSAIVMSYPLQLYNLQDNSPSSTNLRKQRSCRKNMKTHGN